MDWIIVSLTAAVSLIKLGQGFDIDIKHPYVKQADRWLLIRSVLTVIFSVPILFLLLILIFRPELGIILAMMIIAGAPAADLSIQQVEALDGNVALATLAQMTCALISVISTPLLLQVFEKVLELHLDLTWSHLIRDVAVAQFIPMSLSVTLRQLLPSLDRFAKCIIKVAKLLLFGCFAVLIIQHHVYFITFRWQVYLSALIVTVSAFILGVVMAGRTSKNQINLAIESGLRNPGLAYLIASENFLKENVTTAPIL